MPPAKREISRVALAPLWTECPRCGRSMRRDYKNRRTVFWPNRTISLSLQVLRCHTADCPRRMRPYRPELEWHFALPGNKFGLPTSGAIFSAYLQGRANLQIHEEISRLGVSIATRSISNVILYYERLRKEVAAPWPAGLVRQLKEQGSAVLNLLVLYERPLYVLVHECVSNFTLIGGDGELIELFGSLMNRLPVPVAEIYCSPHTAVSEAARHIWRSVPVLHVTPNGRLHDPRQYLQHLRVSNTSLPQPSFEAIKLILPDSSSGRLRSEKRRK
jgi:hypothetical protein